MKRALCILLCLLPGVAVAGNGWSTGDTVREGIYQVTNLADMLTTISIAHHQRLGTSCSTTSYSRGCEPVVAEERNGLIGPHPTVNKVVLAMGLGGMAHAGISYLLPHGWREGWQYITIGEAAWSVHHNLSVGLRMEL